MTATAARPLVLIVDDEPQIHRFLRPALEAAGYAPLPASTGAEGLRLAASRAPDLVLLDLGLPDIDGQDVLRRLRQFSAVPVIVLSARDREAEKIAALDSGADDYVEKPFGVGELLARIRASMRRRPGQEIAAENYRAGALAMDFVRREVRLDGRILELTPREYGLLEMLARAHGRILTHRQLLTSLWGPAHVEDVQYLRVYIGHLRQKLGPAAQALLRTEAGVGYRLQDAAPG